MAKIQWKGGTLLSPVPPVMVSCSDGEKNNILTIAWTGILNSVPPKTYISVRPERYSHDIIQKTGEFVINLTTEDLARSADFCGIYTGAKVDKFERCHLTPSESSVVKCKGIAQSPLSIECRVTEVVPLGSHDMFLADIVAVDVDETLIDADGKLHLEKAKLAAYTHGAYYALGRRLGKFGFSATKKKKPASQKGKKKTS